MNISQLVMRTLMGRRLPVTSGELSVMGLKEEIRIGRDKHGIPYIEAGNGLDAWFGLGFCQGQDRSFQLEMLLRLTRGSLSELVGQNGVAIDRLSRRIGFHRAAKLQVELLEPDDERMLSAFAAGVNAGGTVGCPKPAHEFGLLRRRPTSWSAVDVLAGMNFIALALSTWTGKATRLLIALQDGAEAVSAVDESYQEWMPITQPVGKEAGIAIDRLGEDLTILTDVLGSGGASNNWALSPSRTSSGRPIIANDPHLASSIPPPWYLAHMRTPEWGLAGASFVGLPLIPSGHNGTAAWGVTAGLADNIDLYLEKIGEDGRSVKEGDQFVACELLRETIRVKGKTDVVEEILVTRRGPIISPILDGIDVALSFRAIWMIPGQLSHLSRYHRARSFEEFRRGVTAASIASLNMVYADAGGATGWQLAGNIPRRNGGWGVVPLPGWDSKFEWSSEPYAVKDLPYAGDSEVGFVATANNKPVADDDGPYLGVDWVEGYRLARIVGRLGDRNDWDLRGCMALQTDQVTLAWLEMREAVLDALEETQVETEAVRLLREWDGTVAVDSTAATIYEHFIAELAVRIASVKAPRTTEWALGKGFHPFIPSSFFAMRRVSQMVRLVRQQPAGWMPKPWREEIGECLQRAMEKVRARRGTNPANWAWGEFRPLTLLHPLGTQKPLDRIFNVGPFPWGGDGQTVAQTSREFTDLSANPTTIANMRMVIDVGNWEDNRFVLAGGQSGNPFSPHYTDLLELWKTGDGVPIAWSKQEVRRVIKDSLRLTPRL